MNMLSDSQDTLDCLNVAAKLPALKQLLNECNIGVEKSQDEMVYHTLHSILCRPLSI